MFPRHPDDIADEEALAGPPHWSNDFATYADACEFYGAETPAQLAAESKAMRREEVKAGSNTDDIETSHPTLAVSWRVRADLDGKYGITTTF
jgi:hypothetical protein